MTSILALAGNALYGPNFETPFARELQITESRLRIILEGTARPTYEELSNTLILMMARENAFQTAYAELQRVMPIKIKRGRPKVTEEA